MSATGGRAAGGKQHHQVKGARVFRRGDVFVLHVDPKSGDITLSAFGRTENVTIRQRDWLWFRDIVDQEQAARAAAEEE